MGAFQVRLKGRCSGDRNQRPLPSRNPRPREGNRHKHRQWQHHAVSATLEVNHESMWENRKGQLSRLRQQRIFGEVTNEPRVLLSHISLFSGSGMFFQTSLPHLLLLCSNIIQSAKPSLITPLSSLSPFPALFSMLLTHSLHLFNIYYKTDTP